MSDADNGRRLKAVLFLLGIAFAPRGAHAQDPMLLVDEPGLEVRMHLQVGVNAVAEQNLFWNFADTFAPTSGFDSDTRWLEGYVMPGISFSADAGDLFAIYGKLSVVASGTLGTDAFDAGGTGAVTLEDAYLGLRTTAQTGPFFDMSFGPRAFKAGTGMLIANGGSSGFERGALKLGPRKAWEQAAILRFGQDDLAATAFFIDANELSDKDSGTKIVGTDLRYDVDEGRYAGLTFGHVVESDSPYARAAAGGIGPPVIMPGARDGLSFVNAYGRTNPFDGSLQGFFIGGDFAYQWNPDIDLQAWAGRVQIGYVFEDLSWAPTIAYSYQTFSGDDPATSRLERFDPLYYEGNPSAWSTGTKSSMMFLNTNVNAHQLSLQVKPTEADTWTLRYAHIRANELNSPIQFGQGTRLDEIDGTPTPVAGVGNRHLADDIYLEYSRVINKNTYLTAGASISFPGKGMDAMTKENSPNWLGGFVNVIVNF
ncbi:alginate export family protein [Shinella sp. CPCC 101442]|uniref:alginate export family protein n=1 Tax=Shinella sp. CPCC 101442 TaxID=2932265 RepID=UPI0021530ED2|nr:alginate export family protein [Shinella sp. CPCC 101442]MCR6502452.1 alginate export family protein [Shinella sp. CPCC 101442]